MLELLYSLHQILVMSLYLLVSLYRCLLHLTLKLKFFNHFMLIHLSCMSQQLSCFRHGRIIPRMKALNECHNWPRPLYYCNARKMQWNKNSTFQCTEAELKVNVPEKMQSDYLYLYCNTIWDV